MERGLAYLVRNHEFLATHYRGHYFYYYGHYYGHYYAVQAMYLAGGEAWARWWPAVREELARMTQDLAVRTAAAMPADGYREVYEAVQEAQAVANTRQRQLQALLVTMWPVETSSAHKLTTGLFKYRSREETGLSWARALQRSMIALMDDPGLRHPDGTVVARYAHPLFWGSFVVVGDSGDRF